MGEKPPEEEKPAELYPIMGLAQKRTAVREMGMGQAVHHPTVVGDNNQQTHREWLMMVQQGYRVNRPTAKSFFNCGEFPPCVCVFFLM